MAHDLAKLVTCEVGRCRGGGVQLDGQVIGCERFQAA